MSAKKSKAVAKAAPTNDEMIAALPDDQRERVLAIRAKTRARPRRADLKIKANEDGGYTLDLKDGQDGLESSFLAWEILATRSPGFLETNLLKISNMVATSGNADRDSAAISSALALVAAIEPRDELEATMAVQMVAANNAALAFFQRAQKADYVEHAAAFSNIANKAMRSFTSGAEAIAKLRRDGVQVVRHVTVHDGAQAVFAGTINQGVGNAGK